MALLFHGGVFHSRSPLEQSSAKHGKQVHGDYLNLWMILQPLCQGVGAVLHLRGFFPLSFGW